MSFSGVIKCEEGILHTIFEQAGKVSVNDTLYQCLLCIHHDKYPKLEPTASLFIHLCSFMHMLNQLVVNPMFSCQDLYMIIIQTRYIKPWKLSFLPDIIVFRLC